MVSLLSLQRKFMLTSIFVLGSPGSSLALRAARHAFEAWLALYKIWLHLKFRCSVTHRCHKRELFQADSYDQLRNSHRGWVEENLENGTIGREGDWKGSHRRSPSISTRVMPKKSISSLCGAGLTVWPEGNERKSNELVHVVQFPLDILCLT